MDAETLAGEISPVKSMTYRYCPALQCTCRTECGGGGGGNRTRVHECSSDGSTCVADLFESRRAFSQSAGRRTTSHWISITGVVTPPASSLCVCRCCGLCGSACASLRPDLAQGPASAASHRGLGGESETLVVGVCSVPDGFTRSLVLGMPRTDSLPVSKPGRPQ